VLPRTGAITVHEACSVPPGLAAAAHNVGLLFPQHGGRQLMGANLNCIVPGPET
jgi:hypothetical protein